MQQLDSSLVATKLCTERTVSCVLLPNLSALMLAPNPASKQQPQTSIQHLPPGPLIVSVDVIAELLSNANGTTNIRTSCTDRKTSIQALELFFHMSPKVEVR